MSPQTRFRLTTLAGALAIALSGEAAAQTTLTVNNNADALTAGTLRQALSTVANDCGCFGAPYTVNFAFPGATTIPVNSPLPVAPFPPACTVFIDGYDQTPVPATGATPNTIAAVQGGTNASPRIILDGSGMTGGTGLVLDGANSTVKGLVFRNFPGVALQLRGTNSSVLGSFFGVDQTATACAAQANMVGVQVDFGATGADVGGINAADRNVFGCMLKGIDVAGSDANVFGNLIGTGAAGTALPNGTGVSISTSGFSPGVFIGSPAAGFGNVIARNTLNGVAVGSNRSSVYVQGNDIFLNGGLGIDLGNNGPTPNNANLFPNSGQPNGGQNSPFITFVRYDPTNTSIEWSLNGFSNQSVSIDFHGNPAGLGLDEGARWITNSVTTADGAGAASGSVFLPGAVASPTATATSSSGTSEFSPPASIDVTPKFLTFNGSVGNTSAPQVATFTNIGSTPVTIGPPVTFSDFAAAGSGGCDGVTLVAPGNSCTVNVTFTPLFLGNSFDFLDMATSGTGGGRGIALDGLAVPNPVFTITPPGPVSFGSSLVGTPTAPVTFTVTSGGDGTPFDIVSLGLTGTNASSFTVVSDTCTNATVGTPLVNPNLSPPIAFAGPPVPSCALSIAMNPAATGPLAATLAFQTTATNPVASVALSGTGTTLVVPRGTVVPGNPGPLNFGTRRVGTQSPSQTVTLTNGGSGQFTVASAALRGTGFVKLSDTCTGNTIGTTLTSCDITLAFSPTFEGPYRTTLEILSDATNPQVPIELQGIGAPLPVGTLAAAPGSVSFGTQAIGITTNPQTVVVTNAGQLPVTVSAVRATGDFAQTNDCRTLDPGQNCRALVTFTATAQGERQGNLIVDSDASNRQLVVSLQGTGSPAPVPAVELDPGAVSFGTSLMGSNAGSTAITLRNSGGATLTLTGLYAVGDFRASHNCPTSLPPGGSCLVTVSFVPTIPGSRTGKLVVESNAPAGVKEAPLSGTGCRSFGLGNARLAAPVCK